MSGVNSDGTQGTAARPAFDKAQPSVESHICGAERRHHRILRSERGDAP